MKPFSFLLFRYLFPPVLQIFYLAFPKHLFYHFMCIYVYINSIRLIFLGSVTILTCNIVLSLRKWFSTSGLWPPGGLQVGFRGICPVWLGPVQGGATLPLFSSSSFPPLGAEVSPEEGAGIGLPCPAAQPPSCRQSCRQVGESLHYCCSGDWGPGSPYLIQGHVGEAGGMGQSSPVQGEKKAENPYSPHCIVHTFLFHLTSCIFPWGICWFLSMK